MATVVLPIFTINNFPTEIIEQFAPDLRPRTVSTLRLVSHRFYQVFTSDHFYRSYLCYPDRLELYRKDLEEIGDVEDRWWRLLEKEKERITVNWKNGQTTRVDTIEFPESAQVYPYGPLKALIDESGEYWMLRNGDNRKIVLVNFTNHPILSVHDLSAFCNLQKNVDSADLAPGQVVLHAEDVSHVFNYFKREDSVALEYHFEIKGMGSDKKILSGKSKLIRAQRNLLVTYNARKSDGLLRVWDIKTAIELDCIFMKDFQPFEKCFEENSCKWLHATTGPFPNILVQSRTDLGNPWTMGIINVEKGQMTNFFGLVELSDSSRLGSNVFFNECYAGISPYDSSHKHEHFKLYDLRSTCNDRQQQPEVFSMCKPYKTLRARLTGSTVLIHAINLYRRNAFRPSQIDVLSRYGFDISPAFNKDEMVYVMSIDYGSELIPRKLKIPDSIKELTRNTTADTVLIGPFMTLSKHKSQVCKTFNESGDELIDWRKKLKENGHNSADMYYNRFFRCDLDHIQNLFKCILQIEDGKFVIFNF